jgi:WD40 repeat protein
VGHQDKIYTVAFSPAGQLLASGSNDQTVKLWHAETGKYLDTLTGHSNRIYSLAFSPDGQLLASGSNDQTVKLWEISTHKCEATLREEDIWVYSVAFHPNGHLLASGSNKGTIELWDVSDGEKQLARPLKIERPYEYTNITKATGLEGSRYTMLLALGAIDKR